jgi:hypothetical protein
VAAYVDANYGPMATIPVEGAGAVPIVVLRDRSPTRVDPETGWPCFLEDAKGTEATE